MLHKTQSWVTKTARQRNPN